MEFKTDTQKRAFDKLFNAKYFHHYGESEWVTARQIDVSRNTLDALVKLGVAEHKTIDAWCKVNKNLYRIK
jgi:hypothetical protein